MFAIGDVVSYVVGDDEQIVCKAVIVDHKDYEFLCEEVGTGRKFIAVAGQLSHTNDNDF